MDPKGNSGKQGNENTKGVLTCGGVGGGTMGSAERCPTRFWRGKKGRKDEGG